MAELSLLRLSRAGTARGHDRVAKAEGRWHTLPLFGEPDSTPAAPARLQTRRDPAPLELVLHVYWSAALQAHALGSAASQTRYPDQRRALRELQRLEDRKELAASLLEAIWLVCLPASSWDRATAGQRLERVA